MGQQQRRARRLAEIEVAGQVAQLRRVLADVGARVGRPSVLGLSRRWRGSHPRTQRLTVPNAPSKLDAVHHRAVQFAGQLQARQPGDEPILPVPPALTPLLPAGGLVKGSVTAIGRYGMLCLALMAAASAEGAWCAVAGIPEFGVAAAAAAGVEPDRLLLVPEPGERWLQVAAALIDGCEIVVIRRAGRGGQQ